jgi:uncharacterized membrane protein
MESSQLYIISSIIVLLLIIGLFVFARNHKKREKFTPLAGLAFAFVLSGIIFGDNNLIGYGLMGTGVILAIIDIVIKLKKKKR